MANRDAVVDELLWQTSLTIVAEVDDALRLVRVSRGLADRLGTLPEDLAGRGILEFLPHLSPSEVSALRLTRQSERVLMDLRTPEGVVRVMGAFVATDTGSVFFAEAIGGVGAGPTETSTDHDRLRDELRDVQSQLDYQQALNQRIRREQVLTTATGLYIRKMLDTFVEAEMGRSIRTGRPFALLLCGVDRAQALDQVAGEETRVKVVSAVAKALTTRRRVFDVLGQFSPSEFYIIQPENVSDKADLYARRIRDAITGRKVRVGGVEFSITLSFGIAHFHPTENHYHDRAELVSQAEAALFTAASSGGDRVVFATPASELAERLNRPTNP